MSATRLMGATGAAGTTVRATHPLIDFHKEQLANDAAYALETE